MLAAVLDDVPVRMIKSQQREHMDVSHVLNHDCDNNIKAKSL